MPVQETNKIVQGKIVAQAQNEEGEMRSTTKTFSNLVASVTDDQLYAGLSAVAGLLDVTGASVCKVTTAELVEA